MRKFALEAALCGQSTAATHQAIQNAPFVFVTFTSNAKPMRLGDLTSKGI